MKQILFLLLMFFFFTACEKEAAYEKETSFEILEKEFIKEISLNTDPRVIVNFIKVHNIKEKADLERISEVYVKVVSERVKKIEQNLLKNSELETRETPCFNTYINKTIVNMVSMVSCVVTSLGIESTDCVEDFVEDQVKYYIEFEECLKKRYP